MFGLLAETPATPTTSPNVPITYPSVDEFAQGVKDAYRPFVSTILVLIGIAVLVAVVVCVVSGVQNSRKWRPQTQWQRDVRPLERYVSERAFYRLRYRIPEGNDVLYVTRQHVFYAYLLAFPPLFLGAVLTGLWIAFRPTPMWSLVLVWLLMAVLATFLLIPWLSVYVIITSELLMEVTQGPIWWPFAKNDPNPWGFKQILLVSGSDSWFERYFDSGTLNLQIEQQASERDDLSTRIVHMPRINHMVDVVEAVRKEVENRQKKEADSREDKNHELLKSINGYLAKMSGEPDPEEDDDTAEVATHAPEQ